MVEFTDKPGYAFRSDPPPEVAAFLKGKGDRLSFSWLDVEPDEHAVAFTVAKAMQADVLDTIRNEVQRAIDEGRTLAQFRRDLKPRLVKLGWWGKSEETDPVTGEVREVQLGSPRRLRTIYRANLRAARSAGQWDRIQRTKDALPYLLYQLGPSERHRPNHASKEGLVLPVDHPFWSAWYPPNGWGCKCHVRQITAREAGERGISEEPSVPTAEWTNPRTGDVRRIPKGLDPAWSSNPGAARMRNVGRFLEGKLEAMPPEYARAAAADLASSWRFQRVYAGAARHPVPIGLMPSGIAEQVGTGGRIVRVGPDNMGAGKVNEFGEPSHPEATPERYAMVQRMLETGLAVHDARNQLNVYQTDEDGKWWRVVLKTDPEGKGFYISTFHRASARHARRRRDGDRLVREITPGGP